MKKQLLFVVACLAMINSFSQKKISWGPSIGLNMFTLHVKPKPANYDYKYKTGFNGGIAADLNLSEQMDLRSGIYYSMEGSKGTVQPPATIHVTAKLNYIIIPLYLMYYAKMHQGFYGFVGPQLGILTSAKLKIDGSDEEDVKDDYKSIDFRLGVGLGYRLANSVFLQLAFIYGLLNIYDYDDSFDSYGNQGFALNLGYIIGPNKKGSGKGRK